MSATQSDDDNALRFDDDYYDNVPEGHVLCPRCDGHQTVNCYCGGDLCVCENYGEEPCPLCGGEYGGEGYVAKEVYDRWWSRQKEYHAAFQAAMKSTETGS